jgi:hypothetical protein
MSGSGDMKADEAEIERKRPRRKALFGSMGA